jgi:hypothetical protein
LGIPELAGGLSAALYPVTYLSLSLSKLLFGHYFAGIDIQAIFHLIFGGLGLFILLKELKLDGKSCLFGALTYPLCSFNLYTSNAWIIIGGPISYFPWLVFLGLKLIRTRAQQTFSRKYFILLILARLMIAFVGHTQYFIYSIFFEVFTVILLTLILPGEKSIKQLRRPIANYLLSLAATAILSLPLHLPMLWQMVNSFSRSGAYDLGGLMDGGLLLNEWIAGFTWPFAFRGDATARLYDIEFTGLVTLVFIVEALIAMVTILILKTRNKMAQDQTPKKVTLAALIFLAAAGICFCWVTNTVVPYIIQYIPVLNRFRWPYKVQLFLSFYLIALSACGFYLFFKKLAAKKALEMFIVTALILIQLFTFYQLYIVGLPKSGRTHKDPIPLSEPLQAQMKDGRIISVGFDIEDQYTIKTIGFNYATLWGLYQIGGYDPIKPKINFDASLGLEYASYFDGSLNEEPQRVEYLRKWGVKWYVVEPKYISRYGELNFAQVAYRDSTRIVYRDDQARPFFYWESNQNSAGIQSQIKINSIRLQVNHEKTDNLLINFMYNPFFKATLDGEKLTIPNTKGQISVKVPAGSHVVNLQYTDPFFNIGLYLALLYIAGTINVFCFYPRLQAKKQLRVTSGSVTS